MKIKKDHLFTSTAVANIGVWAAASAAIIYAVKKTGTALPLLAFLVLPRFTAHTGPVDNPENVTE